MSDQGNEKFGALKLARVVIRVITVIFNFNYSNF